MARSSWFGRGRAFIETRARRRPPWFGRVILMMSGRPLRVVHLGRKPERYSYSMERLFFEVRAAMPPDIRVTSHVSSFLSRGIWRRLYNVIEAALRQGDVNHVTGDVHFLVYLLHRKRTVLTIHDCVSLERLRGIKRWILRLLWYRLPVRLCAAVTVISDSSKRELMRFVDCDPAKIRVIMDCIPDTFSYDEHPFNGDCPRILQIGTGANKNLERVAAALAGLKCRWVVIGPLTDAQRTLIEQYGIDYECHVGLHDSELVEQYRQADMLVFVSTYEGFGLPITEANAVGRPVVTSNLSSMPEVAAGSACLVDPYSIDDIRRGILRVLNDADYRQVLIAAGLRNAARFSPKAIAAQYAQLYRELVRSK